ncbi:hypothetical protein C0995_013061 [Termitomyces sp. Mi166|nr:hypothetical protein C0995_013061 [Termitomyces sp. Mi166\
MFQRLSSQMLFNTPHLLSPDAKLSAPKENYHPVEEFDVWKEPESIYDAWLASRKVPGQKGAYLVAGARRPLSLANARLALCTTIHRGVFDFFNNLLILNPLRTALMMSLNIIRSLFPAFRGYAQAMIIDEDKLLTVPNPFSPTASSRFSNENIVLESARFYLEREQLKNRIRLDVPTLADPVVRDLLQEADMFAGSFNGIAFGLLSPLDFVRILSLAIEIVSHIYIVISLTRGASHLGVLLLSIASALLPLFLPWCHLSHEQPEPLPSERESRAVERHERMRSLAYSDVYRPEIALFGLGDWILETWSSARRVVAAIEEPHVLRESSLFSQLQLSDLMIALQNDDLDQIPLICLMQTSSASLGSLTLYRGSIRAVVCACGNLMRTIKMAFQGIFLMSAFCASMELRPRLQPEDAEMAVYDSLSGGVSIEVSGLSYTYPGSSDPALKNFLGKTTLAKMLLRILDFDSGSLKVNGVDVRRYLPADYHRHTSAVFQSFSKFNATVQENVGLGHVEQLTEERAVSAAVHLAAADELVASLPQGLRTTLDNPGFESISYSGMNCRRHSQHNELSGGEWQRIAIARALMRANQPEVDLLLFDEPTSSLDALAQNQIFNTIEKVSRSSSGKRTKTVIFITHRLSTARRADKIAMMENGVTMVFILPS